MIFVSIYCVSDSILHIIKLFDRLSCLFIPDIHINFIPEPLHVIYNPQLILFIQLRHALNTT